MSDNEDVVYVGTEFAGGGAPVDAMEEEADDEAVVCAICLSSDVNVMLDCSHRFHAKCLAKYFFKKQHGLDVDCPYCRQRVEAETEMDVWALVDPSDISQD